MTAKQAAWKIINLNGEPTVLTLIRYGVSENDALGYMKWYERMKRFGRQPKLSKRVRKIKNLRMIKYGFNTAKG